MAKVNFWEETFKVWNIFMSLYGGRMTNKVENKGHLLASQFSRVHPWL